MKRQGRSAAPSPVFGNGPLQAITAQSKPSTLWSAETGKIVTAAEAVRLIREGREVYKGTIEALKRFKDDVKEVAQNFECGIKIGNFDDIKSDDVIEAYRIDIIRRTL